MASTAHAAHAAELQGNTFSTGRGATFLQNTRDDRGSASRKLLQLPVGERACTSLGGACMLMHSSDALLRCTRTHPVTLPPSSHTALQLARRSA
jgi:hypothetical protein